MEPVKIQLIDNPDAWSDFLDDHPYNYFLQTWQWGQLQERGLDKETFRLGFFDQGRLVGVCLAFVEKYKFGRFVYCPRGPVLDWSNIGLVHKCLPVLADYFRDQGCTCLRLDPPILIGQKQVIDAFGRAGFQSSVRSIQVERAWVLDINTPTEEGLFKNLHSGHRRKIRKGQKSGLEVEFSDRVEDIEVLIDLLTDMSERKGFALFDSNYLRQQAKYLFSSKILQLGIARYQGRPQAAVLMAYYHREASFLHGASAADEQNLQASFLLHWESIRRAKEMGLEGYNFWGVVKDHNYRENYPGYGYSRFKRGFGGRLEIYTKPFDFSYNFIEYQTLRLVEGVKKFRGRKSL